ncbi:hypothetical protein nbrc107697_35390 [Gordonia crocea]|uniref:Uncharacterized protein n=1 Tax=Gordonia crocea TaxID=589162 RepID=A0A7I9V391_9ACTN|nr:hypothetical protein nbrc107697_35390 [Gordonia crocea]
MVRPAPRFEHPGRWAVECGCTAPVPVEETAADRRADDPVAATRAVADRTPAPGPPAAQLASARAFAVAAMTVVLEVIDRRRPVGALDPFVAAPVADHVIARGKARHESRALPGSSAPGLRLRRVHIQLGVDGAAEFFGSYTCGDRVRAFAGRMGVPPRGPRRRGRAGGGVPAWQVQGLMLG